MPNLQTSASSRIHVLQVVGNAIVGGMETYVLRLIQRLPPEQFRVSVLCPFESQFGDELRALGTDVSVAPMPDDLSWNSVHMACSLVKTHAIDVIQAHLCNAHVLAGVTGKLTGKPVIGTIHGRQLTMPDLEIHRTAGTHLSVVCKQTYYHALSMGVNESQLHLIPNGVDTDSFKAERRRTGPLRQKLGIPAEAPVVGFVGRLSPEKGPDVFVRSALLVHHLMPDAHFVVIGEGPMRPQLESFIAQFRLQNIVHLAGMQDDMPRTFSELDMVVSSSHSEAMPLALMEAMACGLPVVATSVGGVPDLVQHGVTGWLVTAADVDAIALQVVTLLKDPEKLTLMGVKARLRAADQLALSYSVDKTLTLLTRLAQPRNERRISAVVNGAVTGGSAGKQPLLAGARHAQPNGKAASASA